MEDLDTCSNRPPVDVDDQRRLKQFSTFSNFPFYDLRLLDRLESIFLAPPDSKMLDLLCLWYPTIRKLHNKTDFRKFFIGSSTDRASAANYSEEWLTRSWHGKITRGYCLKCHQSPCTANATQESVDASPAVSAHILPSSSQDPFATRKRKIPSSSRGGTEPKTKRPTVPKDETSSSVACAPSVTSCAPCACPTLGKTSIFSSELMDKVNCACVIQHISPHVRAALKQSCESRLKIIASGMDSWFAALTKQIPIKNVVARVAPETVGGNSDTKPVQHAPGGGAISRSNFPCDTGSKQLDWVRTTEFYSHYRLQTC